MELYSEYAKKASSSFNTADHLAYVTFPLLRENRLILTILDNINIALTSAMNAILEYDRYYKRIRPLPDNFEVRYQAFKNSIIRHNIKESEARLVKEIKTLLDSHKSSPIEFSRKDKFIICTDDYRVKSISIQEVKDYLEKTKSFLMKVDSIIKHG
jgi:DNA-binding ferritin-like protein (Dps family)